MFALSFRVYVVPFCMSTFSRTGQQSAPVEIHVARTIRGVCVKCPEVGRRWGGVRGGLRRRLLRQRRRGACCAGMYPTNASMTNFSGETTYIMRKDGPVSSTVAAMSTSRNAGLRISPHAAAKSSGEIGKGTILSLLMMRWWPPVLATHL